MLLNRPQTDSLLSCIHCVPFHLLCFIIFDLFQQCALLFPIALLSCKYLTLHRSPVSHRVLQISTVFSEVCMVSCLHLVMSSIDNRVFICSLSFLCFVWCFFVLFLVFSLLSQPIKLPLSVNYSISESWVWVLPLLTTQLTLAKIPVWLLFSFPWNALTEHSLGNVCKCILFTHLSTLCHPFTDGKIAPDFDTFQEFNILLLNSESHVFLHPLITFQKFSTIETFFFSLQSS